MNHNAHHEDVRYIVNEEKRTVVAILTVPRTEICEEVCNIINKRSYPYFILPGLLPEEKLLLTGEYKAKAKAHPDDVWDENEGKRRALLRARRIYMKERERIMEDLEDIFDDIEDGFEDARDYTKNVLKAINRELNP